MVGHAGSPSWVESHPHVHFPTPTRSWPTWRWWRGSDRRAVGPRRRPRDRSRRPSGDPPRQRRAGPLARHLTAGGPMPGARVVVVTPATSRAGRRWHTARPSSAAHGPPPATARPSSGPGARGPTPVQGAGGGAATTTPAPSPRPAAVPQLVGHERGDHARDPGGERRRRGPVAAVVDDRPTPRQDLGDRGEDGDPVPIGKLARQVVTAQEEQGPEAAAVEDRGHRPQPIGARGRRRRAQRHEDGGGPSARNRSTATGTSTPGIAPGQKPLRRRLAGQSDGTGRKRSGTGTTVRSASSAAVRK